MRPSKLFVAQLVFLAVCIAALGLAGCATSKNHQTENMLSAAGFHTRAPSTPQQQAAYDALPSHQLERTEVNGKVEYAYADKQNGIVYIGGEQQYQEYKRLAWQQKITDEKLRAAAMNQNASMNWTYWGPGPTWW